MRRIRFGLGLLVASTLGAMLASGGCTRGEEANRPPALPSSAGERPPGRTSSDLRKGAPPVAAISALRFEPSARAGEAGAFVARGADYAVFVEPSGAALVLAGPVSRSWSAGSGDARESGLAAGPPSGRLAVLRMALSNANASASLEALDPAVGSSNYLIGRDPSRWRTSVPGFARVRATDVYPDVDVVYHGGAGGLEYDFVVRPGGDPRVIRFAFEGAEDARREGSDLLVRLAGREVRQLAPVAFQEVDGRRRVVSARYVERGEAAMGFEVGTYDPARPLVIDPVLVYSTYLGGASYDAGTAIAVDGSGNAYLAGFTRSFEYPATAGVVRDTLAGAADVVVTKISPTGGTLVYSTYIGGIAADFASALAVNASGQVFVAGRTSSADFPTTPGAFRPGKPDPAASDAFVLKLAAAGNALLYSTYLGGIGQDQANGLAVDAAGRAYVTGETFAADFPTSAGAFQTSKPLTVNGSGDAFVSELAADGSGLIYSTYLGGGGSDAGADVAIDGSGNAYVTGSTSSGNFPRSRPLQPTLGGGSDAFFTKLSPSGSSLAFSSFLGGSGYDGGRAIHVTAFGRATVAGFTGSSDFPTTAGAYQTALRGAPDAFVAQIGPGGRALKFATLLGGSGSDVASDMTVDGSNNVYLTGVTESSDFPTTPGAVQRSARGRGDAFVAKLATGASLVFGTYLGGPQTDAGTALAVDAARNVFVTGSAQRGFPTTAGAFQRAYSDATFPTDAFVTKLTPP